MFAIGISMRKLTLTILVMLLLIGAVATANAQTRRHRSNSRSSISDKPKAEIQMSALRGKATNLPQPIYPQKAKRAKASGLVTVNVVTDEAGKVIWAKAVSGNSLLRNAAVEAAYRARYTPSEISGRAVKMETEIIYNFVPQ